MTRDTIIEPHPYYYWVTDGNPETVQSIRDDFQRAGKKTEVTPDQPNRIIVMDTGLGGVSIRSKNWTTGDKHRPFQPTEW